MAVSARWPSRCCCVALFLALLVTGAAPPAHAAAVDPEQLPWPFDASDCPDWGDCMSGRATKKCCDAITGANKPIDKVCFCLKTRYPGMNLCCLAESCLKKTCAKCINCKKATSEEEGPYVY